jgi:hypothetical protein
VHPFAALTGPPKPEEVAEARLGSHNKIGPVNDDKASSRAVNQPP